MLHAYFYTICLLFRYTSWHFCAFSGSNLLTSRHSASSLFSAVFVFQKWYTGNILGIGRNKFLKSYFSQKLPEIRRGDRVGPWGGHTPGQRGSGPGRTPTCETARSTSDDAPSPIKIPDGKNLNTRSIFQKHIAIRRRHWPGIGRVQKLFPAP
jgi:hypothetical protein